MAWIYRVNVVPISSLITSVSSYLGWGSTMSLRSSQELIETVRCSPHVFFPRTFIQSAAAPMRTSQSNDVFLSLSLSILHHMREGNTLLLPTTSHYFVTNAGWSTSFSQTRLPRQPLIFTETRCPIRSTA